MRQLKETISIFQGNPLFQGFAAEEIASLLASAPDPTRFARGEQLLSPGSTKRALGFLLEGSALVTRGGAFSDEAVKCRTAARVAQWASGWLHIGVRIACSCDALP